MGVPSALTDQHTRPWGLEEGEELHHRVQLVKIGSKRLLRADQGLLVADGTGAKGWARGGEVHGQDAGTGPVTPPTLDLVSGAHRQSSISADSAFNSL